MDKFMIDPVPVSVTETPDTSSDINPAYNIIKPITNNFVEESNGINELEPRPIPFSWTFWIFWFFVFIGFLLFYFYYSVKYKANEANYVIKKNANGFKISLNEWKEDIKSWLKSWFQSSNDSLYDKSSQFFFRQHIENGAFVSKQPLKMSPKGKSESVDENEDKTQ